ncbi:MAG: tRNA (adenosine(37)-N6)-threonylcarbamoyltransferase complex ATPase subunit type 1 TsaE [Sterolibacterium sp.]|jgi:tRNA threonylcarbamoyladenosine biosynthesis protein TsaE|nr:tRNA (adenosine(37)-N6)-threonylcarbamoyltransferase complex ATPase subunit type 1 TsaE [Sterolibacterium sp.]
MHDQDDKRSSLGWVLPDEAATCALGAALATTLAPADGGLVIYLDGDLGAGKTTLVRGLLRSLGFAGRVKSPTYTFVEPYAISRLDLYHFDFYRFESAEEYLDGGFDEYFGKGAICLVEWPGQAAPYLPPADLRVDLSVLDAGRYVAVAAVSEEGQRCLTTLSTHMPEAPPGAPPGAMSSSLLPPV